MKSPSTLVKVDKIRISASSKVLKSSSSVHQHYHYQVHVLNIATHSDKVSRSCFNSVSVFCETFRVEHELAVQISS